MDELEAMMRFFLRHRDDRQAAVACRQCLALMSSADANVPEEADRLLRMASAFWADKGRRVGSRDTAPRGPTARHSEQQRLSAEIERSNEEVWGTPRAVVRRRTPRYDCGYKLLAAFLARSRKDQAAVARLSRVANEALEEQRFRACRMIYEHLTKSRRAAEVLSPRQRYEWGLANHREPGSPRHNCAVAIWEDLVAAGDLEDVPRADLYMRLGAALKNSDEPAKALTTFGRLVIECPDSSWFRSAVSHVGSLASDREHRGRAKRVLETFLTKHPEHPDAMWVQRALGALQEGR